LSHIEQTKYTPLIQFVLAGSDRDGQLSISPSTTLATPTGGGEVSPKDVFDLLKFSFLLQVS